jgi:hypothetical protein
MNFGRIYEKEGKRGGKMTFFEMQIKFYDEDNNLVVTIINLHIEKS